MFLLCLPACTKAEVVHHRRFLNASWIESARESERVHLKRKNVLGNKREKVKGKLVTAKKVARQIAQLWQLCPFTTPLSITPLTVPVPMPVNMPPWIDNKMLESAVHYEVWSVCVCGVVRELRMCLTCKISQRVGRIEIKISTRVLFQIHYTFITFFQLKGNSSRRGGTVCLTQQDSMNECEVAPRFPSFPFFQFFSFFQPAIQLD